MKYFLDANAVIAVQKNNLRVLEKVRFQGAEDIATSSIVMHEPHFGAFKSDRTERNLDELAKLRFRVIDFDRKDAHFAGNIRSDLRRLGTPIGPYDTLIAGQALARDLTLMTRNTREFARVEGLRVEDWEAA